jgi:hypothetical protein
MMFWRSLAAAVGVFMWATSAQAQIPGVGTKIGGTIDLEVRSVPLPQGIWTVVSVEAGRSTKQNPVTRVYLAELERGQLWRWISITTNAGFKEGTWRRDKDICDRTNAHFNYSDSAHNPNEAECWIVNHWGQALGSHPPQAAVDFFRWSDTLGRPNTSVGTAYFFVKKSDFLKVQYEINPVLVGFPDTPTATWRGNPWHVDVASKDPKKLASLREVKAAGEVYFEQLRMVLH